MQNATSLLSSSIIYAVILTLLLSITGLGSISLSIWELTAFGLIVGVTVLAFGIGSTIFASIPFLGGGAVYTWQLGLFSVVTEIAAYISAKMMGLFPNGTPFFISMIFVMPFLIPILWSMYASFLKSGLEG